MKPWPIYLVARLYVATVSVMLFLLIAPFGGREDIMLSAILGFFASVMPRWLPRIGVLPKLYLALLLVAAFVALSIIILWVAGREGIFYAPETWVFSVGYPIGLLIILFSLGGHFRRKLNANAL